MAVFTGTDTNLRRAHNWNVSGTTIGTNRVGGTVYALFEGATISASVSADGARIVGWQIDDTPFQYRTLANGANNFTVATGLAAGQHRLRFFYDGRGASSSVNRWNGADISLVSLTTDTLSPYPTPPTKNLFIFGDSIMESSRDTGVDTHANSPSMAITEALWDQYQVTSYSLGGTGYLSTGASSLVPLSGSKNLAWAGASFTDRPSPNIVVITMGTNDSGAADVDLTASVASTVGAMLTDFPLATFFVQIPISGIKRSAITAGVTSLGSTRVKLIDCGTLLQRGLSAGANTYYSSDATHPSAVALQAYTSRTLFDIAAGLAPASGGGGGSSLVDALIVDGKFTAAALSNLSFTPVTDAIASVPAGVWTAAGRGLTAPVTTDAASRIASQADITGLATSVAVAAVGTAVAEIPNNVWVAPTRSLTDKADFGLSAAERTATGAAVWAAPTRALTDKAEFALSAAERTAIGTAVWATTIRALTDKVNFALSTAERTATGTAVWASATRTLSATGNSSVGTAVWAATTRVLTGPVTTDLSGVATPEQVAAVITAVATARDQVITQGNLAWITATGFATVNPDNLTLSRISGLLTNNFTQFSATALALAPTGSGGGGGFTEGDRTTLTDLSTRASEVRLVKLDTVATTATAATYKATGFSTPANVAAVTTAVNAARDAVLTQGNNEWATATGFATVNPDNTGIAAAKVAAEAVSARLTDARATNLDTVARDSTAATYRATGFSTPANVAAVTTAVNAARDQVIGSVESTSAPTAPAIATAVENTLSNQLDRIELSSKIASEPITNRERIDEVQSTYTLYRDDGVTPRIVKDLTNASGLPAITAVVEEVPR